MKNSSPEKSAEALENRLALAAQQLAALDSNDTAVRRRAALRANILQQLPATAPPQPVQTDSNAGIERLLNWVLQGLWRPAFAALLPAIIGFAAGVWIPAETPTTDLELYADLRLGHEDPFSLETATNEYK